MSNSNWVACKSRSDLTARLSAVSCCVFDELATEHYNMYGYFDFHKDDACIPVVYFNCGLSPQSCRRDRKIFIGISDHVAGYDLQTGKCTFVYAMPTVFHEFVFIDDEKIVVRDETGFVALSLDGKELGARIFGDIVDAWQLKLEIISGKTFTGDSFEFSIADLL